MRTELTLLCCAIAGIVLWLAGFIYSVEVTAAALLLMAAVYFPFGFYFLYDEPGSLVYTVIAGALLSMGPVCVLLNLLGFNGARLQAGIGCSVLPMLLLVTVLLERYGPHIKRRFYRRQTLRTGLWLLVVLVLFLAGPVEMPGF